MSKLIRLTTVAALCFSLNSVAEIIHFPEELVPLQADDRVIEQSFFSRVDDIELAPGTHKLKLRYTDLYEQGYDNHTTVDSKPFWVQVTIDEGTDYEVVFNRADNAVAAKAFAESPQVSLKPKGSALAEPLSILSSPKVSAAPTVKQVAPAQVATATVTTGKAAIFPAKASSRHAATQKEPSAAAMLDFWWQKATVQERQAFLNKVTKK
ncbi:DUF2057 domain-containing protein [Pseudoalteromonas sp.]|uniref:DUF2057 domain-containing protein n=1 Tax=Pseudoalteromonas sp. TaxID=53249 RepID=UPI003F9ACAF0